MIPTAQGYNDSAEYFAGKNVPVILEETDFRSYSLAARPQHGQILEFGVCGGESINFIADRVNRQTVYGFDSFLGLPDEWYNMSVGVFKLPEEELATLHERLRGNITLVVGLFADTLPSFVEEHPEPIAFMHVDCDVYSSTQTIFRYTGRLLRPGSIILFDEYIDYPQWQEHEHKAFQEFIAETRRTYEYIAFNPDSGRPQKNLYPGRVTVRMLT